MTSIKTRLARLQGSMDAAENPDIEGYYGILKSGERRFFPLSVALGIVMQGFTFKGFPQKGDIVHFEGADGMTDLLNRFCGKQHDGAGIH